MGEPTVDDIANAIPWEIRTGRMNYGEPSIAESLAAFEADGKRHIIVVPSAFPTAAIHTMWDIANPSVGRPLTPEEGIVKYIRKPNLDDPEDPASCRVKRCATVYYTAQGYADLDPGKDDFRDGLRFTAEMGLLELFERNRDQFRYLD